MLQLHWYTELSGKEKRTFWGCFGGWAMDAMDVQMFSFLIPTLIALWKISGTQAGSLGTVALISSAIGGWIGGILSDRYGRVRIMQVTIAWYAFFTCLSGFTTSFEQLLVVRALQGLGFGGEWAAGAVLMGEIIRPEHRGKAVGFVQSAYSVGWGAAALLSTVFLTLLPAAYGWRAMFWAGVLPALLVVYIRRFISEPEVFTQARRAADAAGIRVSGMTIFHPAFLRITLLTSLLALGVQGSAYGFQTWLPTFLRTVHHLSVVGTGSYVFVITVGAFVGYIFSAYLSDAIGRRRNFLFMAIGAWLIILLYTQTPVNNLGILLLGFPVGFFTTGIYSSFGPYFTELFPTEIRATGQSFAYNFGRSIGAFFVTVVGLLTAVVPLGVAMGVLALFGYLLAIVATLLLPETKGIALTTLAASAPARPESAVSGVGARS
jgi:MFS family permease